MLRTPYVQLLSRRSNIGSQNMPPHVLGKYWKAREVGSEEEVRGGGCESGEKEYWTNTEHTSYEVRVQKQTHLMLNYE
jgi:hypothetical protein